MKKSTLYRAAAWVSETVSDMVQFEIDRREAKVDKDENDIAKLACYKAVADYLENMDFLKTVKF